MLDIDCYVKLIRAEFYADSDMFDTDGDGYINGAEINEKVLGNAFSCGMLAAIDDGRIDRREYEYAFEVRDIDETAALNLLYKDNDGMLTRA